MSLRSTTFSTLPVIFRGKKQEEGEGQQLLFCEVYLLSTQNRPFHMAQCLLDLLSRLYNESMHSIKMHWLSLPQPCHALVLGETFCTKATFQYFDIMLFWNTACTPCSYLIALLGFPKALAIPFWLPLLQTPQNSIILCMWHVYPVCAFY